MFGLKKILIKILQCFTTKAVFLGQIYINDPQEFYLDDSILNNLGL